RRIDAAAVSRAANVTGAVVFVPSPWVSQLTPRMWGRGVDRHEAQVAIDHASPCEIETALQYLERGDIRGDGALAVIRLTADHAVASTAAQAAPADAPLCRKRRWEDQTATWSLLPFLAAGDGNTYVRDLHERDTLLRRAVGPFFVVRADPLHAKPG